MAESTPLESFILRYAEAVDGLWQPVEPQVYDVLLPPGAGQALELPPAADMARLAFDPDALADYPQAHLMVFGNPLLDRIFQHAQSLGRVGQVFVVGLNLAPHDLPGLLKRNLDMADGASLQLLAGRVQHYTAALFWFQSTFVSDEQEQAVFTVGVDLHYGRLARHALQLLNEAPVADAPPVAYPEAAAITSVQAYALAREEVVRAITVAAHARLADLQRFLQRETDRISRYFADLRDELAERRERALSRGAPDAAGEAPMIDSQRAALDREEQAQLVELRRKMALSVQVRLLNTLFLVQPKLSMRIRLSPAPSRKGAAGEASLVFDPVTRKPEPWPCPLCSKPTLSLALTLPGQVVCADCARSAPRK